MKKVYCYSREDFKNLIDSWKSGIPEGTAVISISETPECRKYYGWEDEILHYLPSGKDVLNLEFDDIPKDTFRCFTGLQREQAIEIVKFIETHTDYNLVIHCRAGKSRSQGVVRFILDCFPDIWEEGNLENPCISPNYKVVADLKRVLWERNLQ